ncbi:hypothetical protein KM043_014366 [Ampulex compressa]|nr:hypothetical protein KM043_014366 [Ampulex compressa]
MVNASSVVAHLAKLFVTLGCLRQLHEPAGAWSYRALLLLFGHSILGILRFGLPYDTFSNTTAKYFRKSYDWLSTLTDVLPFALLTCAILKGYGIDHKIRLSILVLAVAPFLSRLSGVERATRYRLLPSLAAVIQISVIIFVGIPNGNYNAISLVVSYAIQRFLVDEFSYRYDIPSTDLTQYCLCFVEIFAVLTLNEL